MTLQRLWWKANLDEIKSKYIFVYDQDNDIIKDWIAEKYPEQQGNEVIIQAVE